MGSEYRKPSASADEQHKHIPAASSPTATASQQATPPSSEHIEEPSYQEHGVNLSGRPPIEAPSFYPADLPDLQLQQERWQAPPIQPSQTNGPYPYAQGQQPYGAVPPIPLSLPPQGPTPYVPIPQYQPNVHYPQNPAAYAQQYHSAPTPYTNPQAYQHPANAYMQQPQSPAYAGHPYQGYYTPYGYQQRGYPGHPPPGYPVPPYTWYPPRPRRNGYQLAMAITSLVCSILVIILGIFCGLALLGASITPITSKVTPSDIFTSKILYTALMIAGILGGAFGVLHSSFALALRPSRPLKLPPFWFFLAIYIVLVIVGLLIGTSDDVINNFPLVFPLIALCGILPALTFFTLVLRRLRRPSIPREWPTTWRRFTLALVSGATSAIFLAVLFEGILTLIAAFQFAITNTSFIDNPNAPVPHDPGTIIFYLMIVSVIAPVVEEGFKPLAVITLIGRIRSASEAFILGMACGIGFDMIETTSYIGKGYHHWIDVAIDRSTAGLLHGFGAGMMALGWYYITHKDALKGHHLRIGLGCMLYAILQHAIWNGSFVLQLLPAPIGPYLENGTITIGNYQLDAFLIVYAVFSVLMLFFLWFVTGQIRLQPDAPLRNNSQRDNPATEMAAPVSNVP